jgi:transposase
MFGRETRMLLRHYLEHGTSKSALARELGVSRDTIHRWIRDGDLDRDLDDRPVQYGPRRPPPTKLDPYRAIIETASPPIPRCPPCGCSRRSGPPATPAGIRSSPRWCGSSGPAPVPEPVVRFETPAGRQAQVDFAEFHFRGASATRCCSCSG